MIVLINWLMYSGYFGLIPSPYLSYLFLTKMELSLIIPFMLRLESNNNSSNSISFTMHPLGIIGFPRRIYDYSLLFFKFHRVNPFGIIGIYLSMTVLLLVY